MHSWIGSRTDMAIVVTDPKGVTTWVNPGFEKLAGFSRERLVGKTPGELLQGPETDSETIRFMSEKRKAGEGFEVEILNYCGGTEPYWMSINAQPFYDEKGKLKGFVGVQTDITGRKNREDELGRKVALLEEAGSISGVGAWELDVETGETLWTRQTYAIHEMNETFRSGFDNGLSFYPPDVQGTVKEAVEQAITLGKAFDFEVPFRTAKGRNLLVRVAGVPWLREGKTKKVIGVIRDVTELRENEKALRDAKEKAEAADIAKSQFLATMSHEIRTPLNAILGFSRILKEDPDAEEREEFLELIESSGEVLTELITDILDFSKIEGGGVELRPVKTDLRKWIGDQVALVRSFAWEKSITLDCEIDRRLPEYGDFDPDRLRQVVINLLRNAIKFTNSTGFVSLSARKGDNEDWVLSVEDSGIGIPDDKLEFVFEPFAQVDSSNTRQHGGTGLGLSICQRIVQMMGGRIEVSSKLGEGSTFTVYLPLQSGGFPEKARQVASTDGEGGDPVKADRVEVLLVEDNPMNQRVMKTIVERGGFGVVIKGDGEEALAACKEQRFEIILMDINMPRLNGLEATRRIRASEEFGNPKIIVFSANVRPEDRQASFDAGADEFLPKPVDILKLRKLLKTYRDEAGSME